MLQWCLCCQNWQRIFLGIFRSHQADLSVMVHAAGQDGDAKKIRGTRLVVIIALLFKFMYGSGRSVLGDFITSEVPPYISISLILASY